MFYELNAMAMSWVIESDEVPNFFCYKVCF
jgi:hypothetical protein